MNTAAERLKLARSKHFDSARQAALALGVHTVTYSQYESGERGFKGHAQRFAAFFRVRLEWLLTGRGDMEQGKPSIQIPIFGIVGAGEMVEAPEEERYLEASSNLLLTDTEHLGCLIVVGNSQIPRLMPGEQILYDTRPKRIENLQGKYGIIQLPTGHRLIKKIEKGSLPERWNLHSHNAKVMRNVEIFAAFKIIAIVL